MRVTHNSMKNSLKKPSVQGRWWKNFFNELKLFQRRVVDSSTDMTPKEHGFSFSFALYFRFRADSPRWTLGEFAHRPSVEGEIHQQLVSCSRA